MSGGSGWVGVDLDGTLAKYEGWKGHTHIGEPIRPMVERIQKWLSEGKSVKIFTARVSARGNDQELHETVLAIRNWCRTHIGTELPITAIKDYAMIELWDDRCIQVAPNTGMPALSVSGMSEQDIERLAVEAYEKSRRMGTVEQGQPWQPIAELLTKTLLDVHAKQVANA